LVDYCLVYYWLVFLVLSNISFFGPFSRSFQFSPCKLYIFIRFFFFFFFFFFFLRKLIFSMNFTCYGFKFSSLPLKKCDTSGLFSRKSSTLIQNKIFIFWFYKEKKFSIL
jgi:hypothetical protein